MYEYVLRCKHVISTDAYLDVFMDVACDDCEKWQKIYGRVGDYKVRCLNCTYARYYGKSPLLAEIKASKHGVIKNHTVRVSRLENDGEWHQDYTYDRERSSEPLF